MREAGNYYHVEQSAYWNRFNPAGRQVVISGASITSGPTSSIVAKAYRPVPDDQELTELRNEARDEKDKVVHELEKAKLAREKLEGLTQGLAQTDQVIKEAQTEISELKAQNDDLRRKAAMKDGEKSDRDFGKIEAMSKRSKTDGLQLGPVSDD
jgi:predicted RNase H-like nuclease (RuvC/YqgF family)